MKRSRLGDSRGVAAPVTALARVRAGHLTQIERAVRLEPGGRDTSLGEVDA